MDGTLPSLNIRTKGVPPYIPLHRTPPLQLWAHPISSHSWNRKGTHRYEEPFVECDYCAKSEGVRTFLGMALILYFPSNFMANLIVMGIRKLPDNMRTTVSFGKLQLTRGWAGVLQFRSFLLLSVELHVTLHENNEKPVPLLAPGPTIYPFFGPRSGPTCPPIPKSSSLSRPELQKFVSVAAF